MRKKVLSKLLIICFIIVFALSSIFLYYMIRFHINIYTFGIDLSKENIIDSVDVADFEEYNLSADYMKMYYSNGTDECYIYETDTPIMGAGVTDGFYIVNNARGQIALLYNYEDFGLFYDTTADYKYYGRVKKKFSFFNTLVYDAEDGSLVKTIDVLELIGEEQCNNYNISSGWMFEYQKQSYIVWFIKDNTKYYLKDGTDDEDNILIYNVNTGESWITDYSEYETLAYSEENMTSGYTDDEYEILHNTQFIKNNEKNLRDYVYIESNSLYTRITFCGDSLPDNNSELYSRFPDLKDYPYNAKSWTIITMPYQSDLDYVAGLILEDGEEWNFDGVIVSANDSIDGKEHIISSFKEYAEFTYIDK